MHLRHYRFASLFLVGALAALALHTPSFLLSAVAVALASRLGEWAHREQLELRGLPVDLLAFFAMLSSLFAAVAGFLGTNPLLWLLAELAFLAPPFACIAQCVSELDAPRSALAPA